MSGGFVGKILRVNLSEKSCISEPFKEDLARKFLGGSGYATKILLDELKPGVDPLSPENKLILATGILTGTLCEGSSGWHAVTKSPLTGMWTGTRSGGFFSSELKYAGYDMVILDGRAEEPVYLWIQDGAAEIRDAKNVWGEKIPDADAIIKKEVGESGARIVIIGPSGEKMVRFAAIINDLGRAAGRCGAGAVMGSKNLKAVAVRGSGDVKIADPEAFGKLILEMEKAVMNNPMQPLYSTQGTPAYTTALNQLGALPTKHGKTTYYEKAEDLSSEVLHEKMLIKRRACQACSYGCKLLTENKYGRFKTPPMSGPEYETIDMFGPFALNNNLEAIQRANYICNVYGIDTISAGYMVAFAMECFERGWITEKDTDGIKLSWGDPDVIVKMTEKIAKRDGFGSILAEGAVRAAEKIGAGAPEIALHVKGLEMPGHDARACKDMALAYGTCNRGCCHMRYFWPGGPSMFKQDYGLLPYGLPKPDKLDRFAETEDTATVVKILQDAGNVHEALGVCEFVCATPTEEYGVTIKRLAGVLSALTGWKIDDFELVKIGERIFNLERLFNIREGAKRKDDLLPKRFSEPILDGPSKGKKVENYEKMLDWYYELRGWSKDGVPTKEKLKELDIHEQLNM